MENQAQAAAVGLQVLVRDFTAAQESHAVARAAVHAMEESVRVVQDHLPADLAAEYSLKVASTQRHRAGAYPIVAGPHCFQKRAAAMPRSPQVDHRSAAEMSLRAAEESHELISRRAEAQEAEVRVSL